MNLRRTFLTNSRRTFLTIVVSLLTTGCTGLVDPNQTYSIPRAVPAPITAALGQPFTQIASGFFHNCALDNSGHAWCWGDNQYLQTGQPAGGSPCDQTSVCTLVPKIVATTVQFRSVSVGTTHSCAIATDGSAWCWGGGYSGKGILGDGTYSQSATPVAVQGGIRFKSISVGGLLTCGVSDAGQAYCWGQARFLGNGTSVDALAPSVVAAGMRFTAIASGASHACAITTDGAALCWGSNQFGELGDGVIGDVYAAGGAISRLPVAVKGGYKFQSLAAGSGFTCGVTTDGDALCWGNNHVGELGFGQFSAPQSTPRLVSGGRGFTSVSTGAAATCAIAPGGKAMCWGGNWFGGLGDGTSTAAQTGSEQPQPGAVKTSATFSQISVGGSHVCALTTQQTLKCWGDRARGQMGDGRP
jgi:alpha-tubulin suppressor-like RCC1 family protein